MGKIELQRQRHYEAARDAALGRLRAGFERNRIHALGAEVTADGAVEVPSLCWRFRLVLSPFSVSLLPEGTDVSIVWQILVLEYLNGGAPSAPHRFVSFADFASTRGYSKPFEERVLARLSRTAGRRREEFIEAAERCGGVQVGRQPCRFFFRFFPRFEMQVVRYEGDEDFKPSFNLLFPDNALEMLSSECIVVAAETLVRSLEGKGPAGPQAGGTIA